MFFIYANMFIFVMCYNKQIYYKNYSTIVSRNFKTKKARRISISEGEHF